MPKTSSKAGGSKSNPPPGIPVLVRGPPPEFFEKLGPSRIQPLPKPVIKRSDSAEVVEFLKTMTGGFDHELEALLKLPSVLYWVEDSGGRSYSSSENFGLGLVQSSLWTGKLSIPETPYGFMVYNRGMSVYFLFVDTERRIVVHDRLLTLHGTSGTEEGWLPIKDQLKAVIGMSATSGPGLYSVYDNHQIKQMNPS